MHSAQNASDTLSHAAPSRGRIAMFRFAALAAIVAVIFVPTASAAVTCQTDAAAEIASANVNGPRAGWDPPVWTFDMPDLNMSVDVQAYDHDSAAAKAQAWLQGQVDGACAAANPAPAPAPGDPSAPTPTGTTPATTSAPAPSPDQTQAATDLIAAATVTYVGNSWGPTPLWRVDLPSMNLSIDIAANTEADARAAVVPYVAARLQADAPAVAPATTTTATTTQAAPADAPTAAVAPVTAEGVTTTPVEVERLLTPTLDPGIRAMLLAGTA